MKSARGGGPEVEGASPVTEALDRLLGAPFEQFVPLRKEIAAALRKSGQAEAARAVAAMPKPSRSSWALDQVARRRPELVKAALDAWATAAAASRASDPEGVRATARAFRDRVAEVVAAAGEAASEDGAPLNLEQSRRITATLQAIAGGDDAEVRERLVRGRLVADVDVDDPFAGLAMAPEGHAERGPRAAPRSAEPHPPRAPPGERAADRERLERQRREREEERKERERQERARAVEASRARVAALEAEAKDARGAAREAEVAASRAQAEADRARRAVEAVERKLEEARKELRALGA